MKDIEGYAWREMAVLSYPSSTFGDSARKPVKIDWVFIGIIMSFGAILLTFDAISGEGERGTLRLMFSNPVSRAHVLLGKFLGVLLTMLLPLLVGVFSNLLIITVSGAIPLDYSDWIRLGGMVVLFALYISIFIFIGFLVSGQVSHSITSLSILLLSWVFLAFLLPNLVGLFVCNLNQIPSFEEFSLRKETLLKSIEDQYGPSLFDVRRLPQAPSPQNPAVTRRWAQYLTEQVDAKTRMNDQHLDEQISQVQLARTVTLISPVAIFQYAMEALAGTGIQSYISFVKQVRRYRQEFIDFIKSQDRSDPSSLHIYFVREGLSQKPVKSENVPRFRERITHGSAHYYIAVLVLFGLLFFLGAHVSFLRCDIR
jgi:ABC-type transport system involved in multi-copper enzyme maturation permease subunit